MANALRTRFTYARDVAALDEAVAADREAIAGLAADAPRRFGLLSNLGAALLARYRHLGRDDDLREAVEVGRAAVDGTPDGPRKAVRLTHLSNALRIRYGTTSDSTELGEALAVARRAVELSGEDSTDRAICWSNLAAALLVSYGATGNPAAMDEAVEAGRYAVVATPDGHTDLPNRLSNLALSLHVRYRALGRLADLDEAAVVIQRAIDRATPGHADRPMCLNNLAIMVSDRHGHTSDPQDLDRAIAAGNAAVAAVPDGHPARPAYLSNLAGYLLDRSIATDSARDLDDSVSASRAAVATALADNPDRPAVQLSMALALRRRYLRTRRDADLEEATALIRQAIDATAPGSPRMATFLLQLGRTLLVDQNDSVDPGRAAEAIDLWRQVSAMATAPIGTRLDAANTWARVAYLVGDYALATDGFAAAVGLLPVLAWHGLDQATRETHISDWYGLSADAAACAIRAGRPELAVELLDRGRGVLWNQLLNVRTDLSYARRLAPEIVDRLTAIRAVLDAVPSQMDSQHDPLGRSGDGAAAEQRIVLAREWDTLTARLRALPGLESFMSVIPYDQLRAAARHGPVVIVNASAYRCDALIVTDAAEPQVVPLPELTIRDVTAQANALLGALLTLRRRDGLPARVGLRKQVDRTLSWLWEMVAGPIVTALGLLPGPADGTVRPRIWWSPTGPLTVLPLHAARPAPTSGEPNELDERGLLDRVTSSYTSTLTALIRARGLGRPDAPRLAAVAVADAARLPGRPLAHVADELDVLRACCTPQTTIVDGDATVARVVDAMGSHEWLHFACHAGQNVAAPSTSALYLHDEMLSVSKIAGLDLQRADLAFLSACQTAVGGVDVPDEAIHPAAALQVAGFRHVIATLWPIDDAKAIGVVEAAYRSLDGAGQRDSDRAATALHDAVLALRARQPSDYAAWAAYIHIGP